MTTWGVLSVVFLTCSLGVALEINTRSIEEQREHRMGISTQGLHMMMAGASGEVKRNIAARHIGVRSSGGSPRGDPKCPCIGANYKSGELNVTLDDLNFKFTPDTGSSCKAWEKTQHPACETSDPPSWCYASWCYVDPCNCLIDVLPKVTAYFPDALFQGKPVFWSYATCGEEDTFSDDNSTACLYQQSEEDCVKSDECGWSPEVNKCGGKNIIEACSKGPDTDPKYAGNPFCECVGIQRLDGYLDVKVDDGSTVPFPASVGASCKAWDDEHWPACKDPATREDWCADKFCWVDPCKCMLSTPPKKSQYFQDVTFAGKPLYYSYATCGGTDHWTSEYSTIACADKMSVAGCSAMDNCVWTGIMCVNKELAGLCFGSGSASRSASALASLIITLLLPLVK